MTDPSDKRPLAPRRSLGPKAKPGEPTAESAESAAAVQPPSAPKAAASGWAGRASAASAASAAASVEAPAAIAAPAESSESLASVGETRSQSAPQPTSDVANAQAHSGAQAETERSLPVPPVEPDGGASTSTVDKKADRAAAKARRKAQGRKPRTIRRAKLRVVRVDPWSITKSAFLLSIAFGVMCAVAVFLVFSIMSASGLWDSVNTTIQGVVNQKPAEAFDINDYVGMSRVMGITMLICAVNVIIFTALATLGAFIYNMSASLLGGVEVTLAEDLN